MGRKEIEVLDVRRVVFAKVKSQRRGVGAVYSKEFHTLTSFIPAGIRPQIKYCLLSGAIVCCLRGGEAPTGTTPYPFVYHVGQKNSPYVYLL